jgi:hypothetical protein
MLPASSSEMDASGFPCTGAAALSVSGAQQELAQNRRRAQLKFRERMESGNGFTCVPLHRYLMHRTWTTNVIGDALQLRSGTIKTRWVLQFCARAVRLRMQLDVNDPVRKLLLAE